MERAEWDGHLISETRCARHLRMRLATVRIRAGDPRAEMGLQSQRQRYLSSLSARLQSSRQSFSRTYSSAMLRQRPSVQYSEVCNSVCQE